MSSVHLQLLYLEFTPVELLLNSLAVPNETEVKNREINNNPRNLYCLVNVYYLEIATIPDEYWC